MEQLRRLLTDLFLVMLFLSFLVGGCSQVVTKSVVPEVGDGVTFRLDDHLDLVLQEPLQPPWVIERDPPDFLVDLTVAHAKLHLAEQGRTAPDDLQRQVRARLSQNEVFVVNRKTLAHLDIDISRSDAGMVAVRRGVVEESARYAEAELKSEKDISQLQSSLREFSLSGVDHAFLLEAEYLQDEEFRRFRGIIAAIGKDWLFLYFTGYQNDAGDWSQIEQILQKARFRSH